MHQDSSSRRRFLESSLAAGTALATAGCRRSAAERPNILWIIAEDFSPELGCYGDPLVHTPNLDRLAADGVRFTRAYVTAPVCSAARSAIATGMYQTSIGAHHHRSHRDKAHRLPDGVDVFTHYFRQAGYHTSNVRPATPGVKGTGKTDFNFHADYDFDADDWAERRPGQPFYAQINFPETHRVFSRFPDRPIDPALVELPPFYPDHPAVRLDWALYLDTAQNLDVKVGMVLQRLEEEGLAQDTIVFFFGDHGRPMPRDKQFLYEGGIRIPLIVRFPERVRPADAGPGHVRGDLVSALDITFSSLELAGITPPSHMQGRSLFGPGRKPREHIIAARDRCDETEDRIRCVRAERFKYLRNYHYERPYTQPNVYKDTAYPPLQAMRQLQREGKLSGPPALFMAASRPPEELYDLETDPHELRNLAASSEHLGTLRELRAVLDGWIRETGDQGETPEGLLPDEYKYRAQVDGWCSRGRCILSRSGGALRVDCSEKGNEIRRSYVAHGGPFSVRFRARSRDVRIAALTWATIEEMNAHGQNITPVDFTADGEWREYLAPLDPGGYLATLRFDLGDTPGVIEFDWVRLHRGKGGEGAPLARWEFA